MFINIFSSNKFSFIKLLLLITVSSAKSLSLRLFQFIQDPFHLTKLFYLYFEGSFWQEKFFRLDRYFNERLSPYTKILKRINKEKKISRKISRDNEMQIGFVCSVRIQRLKRKKSSFFFFAFVFIFNFKFNAKFKL